MGDDETGRSRISRSDDWVRIEIETALKKNIPVIPVLIDRTPMPPPYGFVSNKSKFRSVNTLSIAAPI
jgi:hypothetical protein